MRVHTETLTIVFTDLVGSTELSSRLGHDAYEAVRRPHFESVRQITARHGGTEIKSTGDGLCLSFTSAADAIACAVAIQQTVDLAARAQDGELRLRIGASSGEATRDGNDIFGPAVVEAARLCAAAAPSQILVSDLVRALTRGSEHQFIRIGELALKGLPEPIAACEVPWQPLTGDGSVPLPPRIATTPRLGLFGRTAEQALLARAWAEARGGERQLVLIGGEPGIGKTRLATEAARAAHAEEAVVLFGACDEDLGLPYRCFVEALRHYVAHAPAELLSQHVREHHGELLRLCPELAERLPGTPRPQAAEAETERYLMFEAVTDLLAAASQRTPIVLVLDDLQWAGAPGLLLLKHIVRAAVPMRLLIIGTYRDTELSRTHPLVPVLADLRREAGTERIALHGLDETGVLAFVAAAAGQELDAPLTELAQAIGRETEGSPLFIGEILRNLRESGAVFREGERWAYRGDIASLGIPDGVKEAIGRRLSRLSGDTNKVLSLAAVIGREFDLTLLSRIAELVEDAILDALDEAAAAAVVAEVVGETDRYAFTHALIRATLYEQLHAARRVRMHRRVGEALERLAGARADQRIEELARHWMAATPPGDVSKAIDYARRAGDRALAGLGFEEAARYYQQALQALDHDDSSGDAVRCDLLIALANAQRRAGDVAYRETVARAVAVARALNDPARLALAALGHARPGGALANTEVVDRELIALYREASAALGADDASLLRARLMAQLGVELVCTPQRAEREKLSADAVAIIRHHADKTELAQALNARAFTIYHPASLTERLSLSAELAALADDLDSIEMRWHAAYHRLGALMESGDTAGAAAMLARMDAQAATLRQPYFTWLTAVTRATLAIMRGAPEAERLALAAFQIGTAGGQPDARSGLSAQMAVIRRDQGRSGELLEPLLKLVAAQPHFRIWRVSLACLYCDTGRLDDARRELEVIAAGDLEIAVGWSWASEMMNLAQLASDLGERGMAEVLYPQVQPFAAQAGMTAISLICYGSLAYAAGLLAACRGLYDEAEQHFELAIAMNESLGARPHLVRSRRAFAAMLLARGGSGDGDRAAGLVVAGLAEAEALGMQREAARLSELRARAAEGQAS